jgi:Flp pilus assembly protein TadD
LPEVASLGPFDVKQDDDMESSIKVKNGANSLAVSVIALGVLSGCSSTGSSSYMGQTDNAPDVMLKFAKVSEETGNYGLATEYYARVIAKGDASVDVWSRRGELLLQLGAVKNARAHYEAAILAGYDTPEIRRGYGRSLVRVSQPAKALAQFDLVLEQEPKNTKAMNGRGVALDMLGRHVEAQVQYMDVQEVAPHDLSVQNNLALSYTLAGNALSAIAMLEDVYLSGQSSKQHRQNLALLYGLTGQTDKAIALSHQDLRPELVGRNIAAYATLSQSYAKAQSSKAVTTVAMSTSETVMERTAVAATDKPVGAPMDFVQLPPVGDAPSLVAQATTIQTVDAPTMAVAELSESVRVEMVTDVTLLPLQPTPEMRVALVIDENDADANTLEHVDQGASIRSVATKGQQDAPVFQQVQVANLPLMATKPNFGATPARPSEQVFHPVMQVAGFFQNDISQRKPRSVVRRVEAPDGAPSYESLADLELASMKADLDAFGNPLRVLPASKVETDPVGDVGSARQAAVESWII